MRRDGLLHPRGDPARLGGGAAGRVGGGWVEGAEGRVGAVCGWEGGGVGAEGGGVVGMVAEG